MKERIATIHYDSLSGAAEIRWIETVIADLRANNPVLLADIARDVLGDATTAYSDSLKNLHETWRKSRALPDRRDEPPRG
jgi:hypothetical protein